MVERKPTRQQVAGLAYRKEFLKEQEEDDRERPLSDRERLSICKHSNHSLVEFSGEREWIEGWSMTEKATACNTCNVFYFGLHASDTNRKSPGKM